MTRRRMIVIAGVAAVVGIVVTLWAAVIARRRVAESSGGAPIATAATSAAAPGRKIKARLYYVSMDGTKLTGVDREVAYGDGAAAQAQQIVSAQLSPVSAPFVSAVPPATTL